MTVHEAARGVAMQLQVLLLATRTESTYAADAAAEALGNCLANLGHAIAREARHGVNPEPSERTT